MIDVPGGDVNCRMAHLQGRRTARRARTVRSAPGPHPPWPRLGGALCARETRRLRSDPQASTNGRMRAALRDPEIVYHRRWLTLLVLCISLIVITLDNTILNVALPTLSHPTAEAGSAPRPASCSGSSTPTSSSSPACCSPPAASATASAATARSPSGSPSSASAPRCRPSPPRPTQLIGTRCADGHRRRVHHAVHALDHHERLHEPSRAGQGHRRVGGRVGPRHRARPDHRRLPARALLVGLDLHREHPDRPRGPGPGLRARPRVAGPGSSPGSTRSAPASRSSGSPRCCGPSSRRRRTDGGRARSWPASPSAPCIVAAFMVWELRSSHPMLDMRFFENPRFSAASGGHHPHVLRPVRHAVPADAVPAVRARLLDHQGGRGPAPAGRGADGRRAALERVGAALRQQGGRDDRPAAGHHLAAPVHHARRRQHHPRR